jgi:hypothetical protein
MKEYARHLLEYSGKVLDTVMFSEIIDNAASLDTAAWEDDELNNLVVVNGRSENIAKDYVIKKLHLSGKKQMRYYSRYVSRYNETEVADREIYYFSKPVYSNSGKYAVIQWDNAQGELSGRAGINLYHLDGSEWKEVGVISSWKY